MSNSYPHKYTYFSPCAHGVMIGLPHAHSGCSCVIFLCRGLSKKTTDDLMPPSKKPRAEMSRALFRLADRLAALQYPYHFVEAPSATELADAFSPRNPKPLWWQLRDALVFLEDTAVRMLDPRVRPYLRAKTQREFVEALDRYLSEMLECDPATFPEVRSHVITVSRDAIHALASASDFSEAQLLSPTVVNHVILLLSAVADVGLRFMCADYSNEVLWKAHQQWTVDHPRRLVMSTETRQKTPPPQQQDPDLPCEGTSEATDPQGSDQEIFALLKPIYAARGIQMPVSAAVAVQETSHFLRAAHRAVTVSSEESAALVREAWEILDQISLFNGKRSSSGTGTKEATAIAEFDRAVKALRLVYTLDLRDLQNSINRLIGEMQNFTSTCKTDPRLGRVGK